MIDEIIGYNDEFVRKKKYEKYQTSKYPNKKLAIVSCMDTRLTKLLPAALGLENGDAKIIKNAGGVISHPYGSVVRSLLIAIYELGVEHIMVIGHTGCGVQRLDSDKILSKTTDMGIDMEAITALKSEGVDVTEWLRGFATNKENVLHSLELLANHPLVPKHVIVRGFVMDSDTGELIEVVNGG